MAEICHSGGLDSCIPGHDNLIGPTMKQKLEGGFILCRFQDFDTFKTLGSRTLTESRGNAKYCSKGIYSMLENS